MDAFVRLVPFVGAAAVVLLLGVFSIVLLQAALPVLTTYASDAPVFESTMGPPILGTLLSAGLALLIAIPLSLGAALYITEYAPPGLASRIGAALDALGVVPALVFGMWGLVVLTPFLGRRSVDARGVDVLVTEHGNAIVAAFVLALMLLPYLCNMARRLIGEVPTSLREAAVALGATRWEVIRHVVLPHVRLGLFGAALLGMGRAMGEAMAVILVIGNGEPFAGVPRETVATVLLAELHGGPSDLHASSLALLALLMLALMVVVHGLGRRLVRSTSSGGGFL